jgi:hypothetical protein
MRFAPDLVNLRTSLSVKITRPLGARRPRTEVAIVDIRSIMNKRTVGRFAAIAATVMLATVSVANAGPGGGGGHGGGGGGGHGGGGGFHGGGHGGFAYRGGYGGYRGGYGGYRGGYGGYRGGYGGYRGYGHGGFYGRGWWGWGLGIYVPFLPWYYATYWWGGLPYYYADGSYYLWDNGVNEYQEVDPPSDANLSQAPPQGAAASAATPTISAELFAYPKAGQSEAQQKRDKDECRRWAATETGFDAAQANAQRGNDAATRQGYVRAQAACLEGRNYSVR